MTTPSKPAPRLTVPLLIGLAVLSASAPFATDMYLPSVPDIVKELESTPSNVQLSLSAFMVGMGVGNLIIGPISDAVGRKRLLVGGAVLSAITALLAALAPTVAILVAARLFSGFGAGACIVLSRAVIPDLSRGKEAAKAFSLLMSIQGVAPVLAPVIGGLLADPVGWRGVFGVLVGFAVLQILVIVFVIPETKPVEERSEASVRGVVDNALFVLKNRSYRGYTVGFALTFASMFCYLTGSPFVIQDVMGFSAAQFSLIFMINSLGLVAGAIINGRLIGRFDPLKLARAALGVMIAADLLLAVCALVTLSPLVLLPILFVSVASVSTVMSNVTALGMAEVRERSGSGSAVMGFAQFGLAGLLGPLVSLGSNAAFSMAACMFACTVVAMLGLLYGRRHASRRS